jgi:hypothetical protein
MKITIRNLTLASMAVWILAATSVRAQTIAKWTFEDAAASALPNTWSNATPSYQAVFSGSFNSDISAYGTGAASGTHASTATYWLRSAGDGSARSFSSDHWAIGDYYQFTFTPTAYIGSYSGINVSWDQTRSASGPTNWYLAYSLNGSAYTQVGSGYAISAVSWSSSTYSSVNSQSINLGSLLDSTLNAGSTVYFEIVCASAPSSTGGTSRIDNFTVASTVPEPTSMALLAGGLMMLFLLRRRTA